jgi:hypothetical protein
VDLHCFLKSSFRIDIVWIIRVSLLAVIMMASHNSFASSPVFSPGEVIVKFRALSEESQAVKDASKTNDPQRLSRTVKSLEDTLGLPLMLKQLLSDERILLSINCNELIDQVAARLRQSKGVSEVLINDSAPHGCRKIPSTTFKIEFAPGSVEHKMLMLSTDQKSEQLQNVILKLQELAKVPIEAGPNKNGHLELKIDIARMTTQVAEHLKMIDTFESVQLNYVKSFR